MFCKTAHRQTIALNKDEIAGVCEKQSYSAHRQQKTAYSAGFHAWANLFFQNYIFDFYSFPARHIEAAGRIGKATRPLLIICRKSRQSGLKTGIMHSQGLTAQPLK